MRFLSLFLATALLAGCAGGADEPPPTLPDSELAPTDAFIRSVRVGTTSYLYRRRPDDQSLFDVRVAGLRRANPDNFLEAVSTVYGCTGLRLLGVNRQGTAALVKGSACKRSQYFVE
jgi:hypothetical protein